MLALGAKLISAAPGWFANGKPIIAWALSEDSSHTDVFPVVWNSEKAEAETTDGQGVQYPPQIRARTRR